MSLKAVSWHLPAPPPASSAVATPAPESLAWAVPHFAWSCGRAPTPLMEGPLVRRPLQRPPACPPSGLVSPGARSRSSTGTSLTPGGSSKAKVQSPSPGPSGRPAQAPAQPLRSVLQVPDKFSHFLLGGALCLGRFTAPSPAPAPTRRPDPDRRPPGPEAAACSLGAGLSKFAHPRWTRPPSSAGCWRCSFPNADDASSQRKLRGTAEATRPAPRLPPRRAHPHRGRQQVCGGGRTWRSGTHRGAPRPGWRRRRRAQGRGSRVRCCSLGSAIHLLPEPIANAGVGEAGAPDALHLGVGEAERKKTPGTPLRTPALPPALLHQRRLSGEGDLERGEGEEKGRRKGGERRRSGGRRS